MALNKDLVWLAKQVGIDLRGVSSNGFLAGAIWSTVTSERWALYMLSRVRSRSVNTNPEIKSVVMADNIYADYLESRGSGRDSFGTNEARAYIESMRVQSVPDSSEEGSLINKHAGVLNAETKDAMEYQVPIFDDSTKRRKLSLHDISSLPGGDVGPYWVKLTRLWDPEPKVIWEGMSLLYVQRRDSPKGKKLTKAEIHRIEKAGPIGCLSVKERPDWAEYSSDLQDSSGSLVAEDYMLEIFKVET